MMAEGNTRVAVEVAGDNSHDLADVPLSKPHLCQAPRETPRRSPLKAIRAHCRWCCDENAREVARCPANHCPLWLLRSGHRAEPEALEQNAAVSLHPGEHPVTASDLNGSVLKAIRRRCVDCSGGSLAEVRACKCETCPLHPFRMGRNPNIRLSPERKAELLARLQR